MVNKNTYKFSDHHMEHVNGESATVPGQAYTVAQMFARFAAGDMSVQRSGYYPDEDPDFDDPDLEKMMMMELEDRYAAMQEVQETLNRLEQHKQAKAAAEKAAADKQAKDGKSSKKAASDAKQSDATNSEDTQSKPADQQGD